MFAYSFNNYEKYQEKLQKAWLKFINNENYDYSFLRSEIYESWQISKYYAVNPYMLPNEPLNEKELKALQAKNINLIKIAAPKMEELYSYINGSGSFIFLTDSEGIVIEAIGDKKNLLLSGPHTRLKLGASWNISDAGTNSAGLCLLEKRPMQVVGNEHYKLAYKDFTCSGAPIFDSYGTLIGSINLSALSIDVTTHTMGMITNIASSIENSLKLIQKSEELNILMQTSDQDNPTDFGLLVLNNNNIIINANSILLKQFSFPKDTIIGQKLSDVLKIDVLNGTSKIPASPILVPEGSYSKVKITSLTDPKISFYKKLSIQKIEESNKLILTVLIISDCQAQKKTTNIVSSHNSRMHTAQYTFEDIIGNSETIRKAVSESKSAAKCTSNILITGESGTGKELFAQSIHNAFDKNAPFVAVNCGAIPESLIESELFGYKGGAFTGGRKEGAPGKFEIANGGTLFLDEVGEMPLHMQIALLRVLETKTVSRIGSSEIIPLNIRVIAATNKDLSLAVDNGSFRPDLMYRLNVINISIPPLKERKSDIITLCKHFIDIYNKNNSPIFIDDTAYNILISYSWPGNVRELSNAIERAIVLSKKNVLTAEDFSDIIFKAEISSKKSNDYYIHEDSDSVISKDTNCSNKEYATLVNYLKESNSNIDLIAKKLNISSRTLYRRLKKYNIYPKDYRNKL